MRKKSRTTSQRFQHLYQTKFAHDKMNTICANNEAAQMKSGITNNITSGFCVAVCITLGGEQFHVSSHKEGHVIP